MKYKYIIFVIIILTICFLLLLFFSKNDKVKTSPKNVQEQTEEDIELLLNPNANKKDLEKKLGIDMDNYLILVGDNSSLRDSLNDKFITKYHLEKYKTIQTKYAEVVENTFLNDLNYKIIKSENLNNGGIQQTIEVVGFYYSLYETDLSELKIKIYELAGYSIDEIENNEKNEAAFYKAKVKAMEIMNDYVQDYENYNDKRTFTIEYDKNGNLRDSDEMVTLILNLKGMTYDNMNFSKEENVTAQKERIEKYISAAIADGTLDQNNPLSLK